MSEVDEYLRNNTFYCDILRAKISPEQCRANCTTAIRHFRNKGKTAADINYQTTEAELVNNGLWDRGADTATIKCMACGNFVPPTPEDIIKARMSGHIKRYEDTQDGSLARQIIAYITHSQEKLNAEEYAYLSTSPPVSADVSKLHSRAEKMGTHVHASSGTIQTDKGEC